MPSSLHCACHALPVDHSQVRSSRIWRSHVYVVAFDRRQCRAHRIAWTHLILLCCISRERERVASAAIIDEQIKPQRSEGPWARIRWSDSECGVPAWMQLKIRQPRDKLGQTSAAEDRQHAELVLRENTAPDRPLHAKVVEGSIYHD